MAVPGSSPEQGEVFRRPHPLWGDEIPIASLETGYLVPRFIRIEGTNAMEVPGSAPWQREVFRRPHPLWGDEIPIASLETGY